MGKFSVCLVLAIGALAACGSSNNATIDAAKIIDAPRPIDAKVFLDAPPPMFDFSCVGNSAPTTATATITISGTVQEIYINGTAPAIRALVGAALDACKADCTNANHLDGNPPTATMTSATTTGTFSTKAIPTLTMPLDGYMKGAHSGDRNTLVFPPAPLIADLAAVPMLVFETNAYGLVKGFLGVSETAGNGSILVGFLDCMNMPISDSANLVVTVKQGGVNVTGAMVKDVSSFSSMLAGSYVVFNVPPGLTEIGATYKGTTVLRTHTIRVTADSTTETLVRPGY
jgi:hypothetical protein